jgi:VWFA-related protein
MAPSKFHEGEGMRMKAALLGVVVLAVAMGSAQEANGPLIRAEKKLVLVDVVVTDKKDNYVHGLTAKDFRVWQDKDEQTIETFSSEVDPAAPTANRKHYLVLFFDNSTMGFAEQTQARQAALRFLDKNTAPNRLIAVVNFGGSLRIAQNFTSDAERLKQVVSGVKFSAVSSNEDTMGGPALSKAEADFGARTVLLGLRSLAKSLSTVPGRKTLIFLSAGFKLDSELRSELTAVVDVCNKANVAVYPIDVRGLVAGGPAARNSDGPLGGAFLLNAAYGGQQRGGGGATGGGTSSGGGTRGGAGGSTGGGTGGGRGGSSGGTTTGISPGRTTGVTNPLNQSRSILPHIPDITTQQDVLYILAQGTGGFVIVNTNDLLGGLDRIANEQNEYYVLGYSPGDDDEEGACHELKVKVDRGGVNVRSRTGYCRAKAVDLLAGSAKGRELENRAAGSAAGNVSAKMQTAFFYTGPNTARVDVAMEMPADMLNFKKEKGKQRAELNVLGIAYNPEGGVAAKFSDTLKMEFQNKKEVEEFEEKPLHYETQFEVASGKYTLKVVFSANGQGFGKLESPLVVDPYDNKKFGLSAIAMSREMRKVNDVDTNLDATLLADKTPLIVMGMQLTPDASNIFQKGAPGAFYIEIYEPSLTDDKPHKVALKMVVVDAKTKESKLDTGLIDMSQYARAGNPVIPVGLRVPSKELAAGLYRVEFTAADDAGNVSVVRTADFEVRQ